MSPRRRDDARSRQLRRHVAETAARLLLEGGHGDLETARRKAAAQAGVRDEALMPGGDEIRDALRERQRLFQPAGGDALRRLRVAAAEAMAFFRAFEPRLTGAVLEGDAGDQTPVILHLHADDPDALARWLHDQHIPARQRCRRLRLERDRAVEVPVWEFEADGVGFELWLLPAAAVRHTPHDAVDDRPMARASLTGLRRLLDDPPA